jgi:hypothetical protein
MNSELHSFFTPSVTSQIPVHVDMQLSSGICSLQCDLNPKQKFKLTAKVSCIEDMAFSFHEMRIGMLDLEQVYL